MDEDTPFVERYGLIATASNGATFTIRRLHSRPNGVLESRRKGTFTKDQEEVVHDVDIDLHTPAGHQASVVMRLLGAGFTIQPIPVERSPK